MPEGKDDNPGMCKQSPIFSMEKCDVTKLEAELVSVVGKKPVVEIHLNDVKVKALWDTGSMISLMNKKVLKFAECGKIEIQSVEEFMGGMGLKLSAANQTDLKISGVVVLDFGIEKSDVLFQVPFILTDDDVKEIIIGYNVIEYVVANCAEVVDPHEFLTKISDVASGKIEGVVNNLCARFNRPEVLGEVKVLKDQVIPANSIF